MPKANESLASHLTKVEFDRYEKEFNQYVLEKKPLQDMISLYIETKDTDNSIKQNIMNVEKEYMILIRRVDSIMIDMMQIWIEIDENDFEIEEILHHSSGILGNADIPAEYMIISRNGLKLKKTIGEFRNYVTDEILESDTVPIYSIICEILDTNSTSDEEGYDIHIPWESEYFEHLPLGTVLLNIYYLKYDLLKVRNMVFEYLLSQENKNT